MAQPETKFKDLTNRLDYLIGKRIKKVKKVSRFLEVNERNVKKVFGISMWDLFKILCNKFGYVIEEEGGMTT